MRYSHLTQEERYQIYGLLASQKSIRQIGQTLKRSASTISREIQRNSIKNGYKPRWAQIIACERAKFCGNGRKISNIIWDLTKTMLKEKWSPEQIAGRLKLQGIGKISHETIYQKLLIDKKAGGTLYMNLRCQKPRRKRFIRVPKNRKPMLGKLSIEERPQDVNQKLRLGDWEGDLVIGAGHKQALITIAERKTQFVLLKKVENKTSEKVVSAMINLMEPFQGAAHTLTLDNGSEFASHKNITKTLGTTVYFAHPYSSWERGLNEQVNGLVRQYFPKTKNFSTISHQEVLYVMNKLNSRPRKLLGYKTPQEAFYQLANQLGVALHS